MAKLPIFRQTNSANCGPACLQMVLAYYGSGVSQKKLAVMAKTTKKSGTRPENLVTVLRANGIKAEARVTTLKELSSRVRKGNIAIVDYFLESEGIGHYAVAVSFGKQPIGLNDPAPGNTLLHNPFFSCLAQRFNQNKKLRYFYSKEKWQK